MNTKIKKALPFILAITLAGCVPSLHSLFTDADLIFEPKLVGIWTNRQSKEIWRFDKTAENKKTYKIIYADSNGKTAPFIGSLGKINETLFLDLYPEEVQMQANDFYKANLVPAHTFMKIEQIHPVLKMRAMNPDKFGKMLEADPNLIKHEIIEDNRVVITASTKDIQKFIAAHAQDKDLFGETSDLIRIDPNDANTNEPNQMPL